MMANLFSIFDPSTSMKLSMNWIALLSWVVLTPVIMWVTTSRVTNVFSTLIMYLFNEFKPLSVKSPQILIISISIFCLVMMNNVPGLLPFIFTSSSHMAMTLVIALPLWVGLMIHGWVFNTSNLLIHLIPAGTPAVLMPFMVLIETISNIIRPLTLAIRLAANMIAGHLLITLMTSANPVTPFMLGPVLFNAQMALASLEVAVAFIQAYVFSVLITLYSSESVT